MAGIGFELKKLYSKKGLFAAIRAASYSTVVCVGPMILGIVLLLGLMYESILFGSSGFNREWLVCITTYTLLASLLVTSYFSMVVTRFLSDMLFSDFKEAVLPSFFGVNLITLVIGGILYGVFLFFSGINFPRGVLALCFFMELIVTWNSQSYLTAVKEYRGIFLSYVIAIVVSLAVAALCLWLKADQIAGPLLGLCFGYGCMMIYDFVLIFRRFPDSNLSPFMFLRWIDKFSNLAWIGLFLTAGQFAHLIIIWLSPLKVVVYGLWIGAPYHDVPALLAFLTVLITTVGFVVSVEVNFYPKYNEYYSLFNDKGTIGDILRVEGEMLKTLRQELWYTSLKQLFFTAAAISLGELVLNRLPLGFNDIMFGYFRTLCVGYGIYAVANTILLILLYFTDYEGALKATAIFFVSTSVFTILLVLFADIKFYGFGFLLGSALFFAYSLIRLDYYTKRLPYFALSVQPVVAESKSGKFTEMAKKLESKLDKE